MTLDDADFMLELKNYPETRKFALQTSEEIKKEDHYKWLPNNLQYFQVIEFKDSLMYKTASVGAIRIQDNEVSIWLHRDARGKGLALIALNSVKQEGMTAKICTGNLPSLRAFIRAGFLPIELIEVPLQHYIFKYGK